MKAYFVGMTKVGLIAAAMAMATPAWATVTYVYGGSPSPNNTRDGGIVTYINQNAPITFSFTVANALAGNLSASDIKASILNWTVSGGKPQSTTGSGDIAAFLNRVRLDTEASGNITGWNIIGSGNIAAIPNDTLEFYFDSISGPHDTLKWYPATGGSSLGGAVSTTSAGTFVRLNDVAGSVPEPASWALMFVGFGAVGWSLRRRRKFAVA